MIDRISWSWEYADMNWNIENEFPSQTTANVANHVGFQTWPGSEIGTKYAFIWGYNGGAVV